MKAVYLEWIDSSSCSNGAWNHVDVVNLKDKEALVCITIGFILNETDTYITVYSTTDCGKYVAGDMTIPKVAIRKRRVVSWK